jgi:uncharacterized repeat protein (TIGR01451 family)
MKKTLFAISFLMSLCFSYGQSPGIKWQRPLGGSNGENLIKTLVTSDGNFLYAFETGSTDGDVSPTHGVGDAWLAKVTKDGIVLWTKTYGGPGGDGVLDLQNMPDGGFLLILSPGGNGGDISGYVGGIDLWVAKLSSTGVIEWSHCLGGSTTDYFYRAFVNPDGSVLIYGNENSSDGSFTSNHGGSDLFLCKINNSGVISWMKCFGGTGGDATGAIYQKANGNIIISAISASANFDVPANHGQRDLWVFEVNSSGNIEWSKDYGGSKDETPMAFEKTGANQYTILGQTTSPDIAGYHGLLDLWLITIDTLGNFLWQKTLGGSADEIPQQLRFIPNDSTLLISSLTFSSDGDVTGYHGGRDVWLVKLNNTGAIQWKRSMGGSNRESQQSVLIDSSGNSIHLNNTTSADGDVVGHHGTSGNDIWVYKLNSAGDLVWQRTLGGSVIDLPYQLLAVPGGYTIVGRVYSKDGDITGMHYRSDTVVIDTGVNYTFYSDIWIANLSVTGNLNWQKALGGFSEDIPGLVFYDDGDYYVSGNIESNRIVQLQDGDIVGQHGFSDGWSLRLGPTNGITGKVFLDMNSNGIQDGLEPFFNNATVKSEKPGYSRTSTPYNGWYKNDVDTGNYTTTVHSPFIHYTSNPAFGSSSFVSYFNSDTINFAIQPIPGSRDVRINIFPTSAARPGFDSRYQLRYQNVGTDTVSGSIRMIKDSRTSFVSSLPSPFSVVNDTITWNYAGLEPLDSFAINIVLNVSAPPTVNINDSLIHRVEITPLIGDLIPGNNQDTIRQRVVGSADPNYKTEHHAGKILTTDVTSGSYLTYVINFQNLGTDTAFTVIVRDTLDSKLDWTSFEMVAASHPYVLSVKQDNLLTWTFSNAGIPHAAANDEASKGFIVFHIKPKNNLSAGDVINNTAGIYFDFNLPVKTNNAFTVVESNIVLPLNLISFTGVYRKEQTFLSWSTTNEYDIDRFNVERSINAVDYKSVGEVLPYGGMNSIAKYDFTDNLSGVTGNTFFYRLKLIDNGGRINYSRVLLFKKDNKIINGISINPNPVNDFVIVNINSSSQASIALSIVDVSGKIVFRELSTIFQGNNSLTINNLYKLPPGFYTINVKNGNNKMSAPLIIKR